MKTIQNAFLISLAVVGIQASSFASVVCDPVQDPGRENFEVRVTRIDDHSGFQNPRLRSFEKQEELRNAALEACKTTVKEWQCIADETIQTTNVHSSIQYRETKKTAYLMHNGLQMDTFQEAFLVGAPLMRCESAIVKQALITVDRFRK